MISDMVKKKEKEESAKTVSLESFIVSLGIRIAVLEKSLRLLLAKNPGLELTEKDVSMIRASALQNVARLNARSEKSDKKKKK
jgi:hypothetical protein